MTPEFQEDSEDRNKILTKIRECFVQNGRLLESARKGELLKIEDLALRAGVSGEELKDIIVARANTKASIPYAEPLIDNAKESQTISVIRE